MRSDKIKETLEFAENKKAALTAQLRTERAAAYERKDIIDLLERLKKENTKELVKATVDKIEISSDGVHINPPEDITMTGVYQ